MRPQKRVLIDCDPGIDDALGLFFALASDKLRVEAVTTVYGNLDVKGCTENLINILHITGLEVLPDIGIGSARPLVKKRLKPRGVHGQDGLGDTFLGPPRINVCINDAVGLAISKILSGQIDYIIATGPLTNIAKIITEEPKVKDLVKRIYIMGGTLFVKGSVTPYAEFNIYNDPEAALRVFDSKIPKTLVTLDVTQKIILTKEDLRKFNTRRNKLSRFISDIANFSIKYHKDFRHIEGTYMNDPLCVGIAIDEDICKYDQGHLEVRLNGPERGKVIIKKGLPNVTYCKDVKIKKFKKIFLSHLGKLLKEAVN